MMNLISVIVLLLLLVVSVAAVIRAGRVAYAESKRRVLSHTYRTAIDSSDGYGISLLCSGVSHCRLENLLAVEYADYEVVATVDANDDYALFTHIVEHFGMVRVNRAAHAELSAVGVRALYRSSHRRFRRLILIDKLHTTLYDDFNAAACYASYDHLLPLADGCVLLPDAIERVVVAMAECEGGGRSVICSRVGKTVSLFPREMIVAMGGFDERSLERVPRRQRYYIDEPLVWSPYRDNTLPALSLGLFRGGFAASRHRRRVEVWLVRCVTWLAVGLLLILSAWLGVPILVAAVVTIVLAGSVAYYVASLMLR